MSERSENSLRREANDRGYRLVKYRKPVDAAYGAYNLYETETNVPVGYGFDSLDDVEHWLRS